MQEQDKPHHSFLHKLGSVLGDIGEAGMMSMGGGMMGGGYPGYSPYGPYGGMGSPFGYNNGMMY